MGGTYTRERTKARSRARRRGSRGRRGRSGSKRVRTGRRSRATVKPPAGTVESAARAHSGQSPAGASWLRSLRRRRGVGQRSSQGIGSSAQETGGSRPFLVQAPKRQSAGGGALGDHDEIHARRQKGRRAAEELSKEPFGPVSRHRIAEFAGNRNPEPRGTVIGTGHHEHN